MALTEQQQAAFDKVKEKVDELEKQIGDSLNLQSYGGYYIRNELIKLRTLLKNVEDADGEPDEEEEED